MKKWNMNPSWITAILMVALAFTTWADQINVKVPLGTPDAKQAKDGAPQFSGDSLTVSALAGEPAVPAQTIKVLLPPDANVDSVKATLSNEKFGEIEGTWDIPPVLPPATWDGKKVIMFWPEGKNIVDGKDVDIYQKDAWFPSSSLGQVESGQLRKWKVAEVPVSIFKYNPISKKLLKLVEGDLSIEFSTVAQTRSSRAALSKPDAAGRRRVSGSVVNFDRVADAYESLTTRDASDTTPGYAIITTSAISNASSQLANFKAVKESRGFNVYIVTENTWGGGTGDRAANNIRNWLKNNYLNLNLQYVLLIGNPHPSNGDVPMKMLWPRRNATYYTEYREAPSDYFYADLTGNWDRDGDGIYGEWGNDFGTGGIDRNYEVMVGRIPYYGSISQTDDILAKTISYQSETVADAAWRKKILLPMEPSDSSTPGWHLAEAIKRDAAVPKGYGSHRIYESTYGISPPPETTPCNYTNVRNVWSTANFGAVFWSTHGWEEGAVDIMTSAYAATLPDSHPSFTFQCSCLNAYPENTNNLGYAMLKNGGIATVSATRVSWYSPGESSFTNSSTNEGFTYRYAKNIIVNEQSSGKALHELKQNLTPYGDAWWMNYVVFIIYGDPECGLYSFNADKGTVTCAITPADAIAKGAQWRLDKGTDTAWKNSGESVQVGIGNYNVLFKSIDAWYTPDSQAITVAKDQTNSLSAKYTMHEPAITVTSPNGGEIWGKNRTYNITWTSVNTTDTVKIELLKNGSVQSSLAASTPNDGVFEWSIPDGFTAGADYKVKISASDNSLSDESNSNFTITKFIKLTVATLPQDGGATNPSGQVDCQEGQAINIAVTPASSFVFTKWTINGASIDDANSPNTIVRMGSENATVTAELKQCVFIDEGFEEATFPPAGWTKADGASKPGYEIAHWQQTSNFKHGGSKAAMCPWGYDLTENLITPSMNFSTSEHPVLSFWWESSYEWHVAPHDNGDLFVKISDDGGQTWTDLWSFGDIGQWDDWKWHQTSLDLTRYAGKSNIKLAFSIIANQNARIVIDDVKVYDKPTTMTIVSTDGGVVRPAPGVHRVVVGVPQNLVAVPVIGYLFEKWTITGSGSIQDETAYDTTAILSGDAVVTAHFSPVRANAVLTMAAKPDVGGGSTSPMAGEVTVNTNDPQTITATPAEGCHFVNWTVVGAARIKNIFLSETVVTLWDNAKVTAHFATNTGEGQLTLAAEPAEAGETTPELGVHTLNNGQGYKITASPAQGYYFAKWEVDGSADIDQPLLKETVVILDGDATVTAVFKEASNPAKLTMQALPGDQGTLNPGVGEHSFNFGEHIRISATPAENHHFVTWTVVGGARILNRHTPDSIVQMLGDATVTAHFAKNGARVKMRMEISDEKAGTTNPGSGDYWVDAHAPFAIEAVPYDGYHFVNWIIVGGGEILDYKDSNTIVRLVGDATVKANFASNTGRGRLVMVAYPNGYGTVNPGAGTHYVNLSQSYPITASPAEGYHFVGWLVKGSAQIDDTAEAETYVTLSSDALVTGVFAKTVNYYKLTILAFPADQGTTNPGTGSYSLPEGGTLSINATAQEGYYFEKWTVTQYGHVTNPSLAKTTISITGDTVLTANFKKQEVPPATLTIAVNPAEGGSTLPGVGTYEIVVGQQKQVVAVAQSGYKFTKWSSTGSVTISSPNDTSTNVTVNGDSTVTANFQKISDDEKVNLTMRVAPENAGSTNPGTGSHQVIKGDWNVITATPADGYYFVRWSADCCSVIEDDAKATTRVAITADTTITASFEQKAGEGTLTMKTSPNAACGYTTPEGTKTVTLGESTRIAATANEGYHFLKWSVDGAGEITNTTYSETYVSLSGNATVTAHFEKNAEKVDLIMAVSPENAGSTNPTIGSHKVSENAPLVITAYPNVGFMFVNWSIEGNATIDNPASGSCILRCSGSAKITANFEKTAEEVKLTMTVNLDNSGTTNPAKGEYAVTANQPQDISAAPANGYVFSGWQAIGSAQIGDIRAASTTITLYDDTTVVAFFEKEVGDATLTLALSPVEGGAINPGAGSYAMKIGEAKKITATADEDNGYSFEQWIVSGSATVENATTSTTSVVLNGDATVTAKFAYDPDHRKVKLTMIATPQTGGWTNYGTGVHELWANQKTRLRATAATGYFFVYWSIEGAGEIEEPNVEETWMTLSEDVTITAHFVKGCGNCVMTMKANPAAGGYTNYGTGDQQVQIGKRNRIEAQARDGYVFTNWTVEGPAYIENSDVAKTYVKLTDNATVIANFKKSTEEKVTLTMALSPDNSGSTNPGIGSRQVAVGEKVQVAATPNSGYRFDNWTLSGSATIDTPELSQATVTVTGNTTVTANFVRTGGDDDEQNVTLVMAASPAGKGTTNPGTGQHTYPQYSTITIAATPQSGYSFANWTVSGSADIANDFLASTTVKLSGDATITANFEAVIENVTLTMAVSPSKSGTTNPGMGQHVYPKGQSMQIKATPNSGYTFQKWLIQGQAQISSLVYSTPLLTITGDATVTAVFVESVDKATLTIACDPTTAGSTSPAPGQYSVEVGSSQNIIATPKSGYVFAGWTVTGAGLISNPSSKNTTLTVNGNVKVTAFFQTGESDKATLTMRVGQSGAGSTNPGVGTYQKEIGASFTIKALPNSGYQFVNWSIDGNATINNVSSSTATATMNGNATLTANFKSSGGEEEIVKLTLAVNDESFGATNPGTGVYTMAKASSRSIQAIAVSGYHFVSWEITKGQAEVVSIKSPQTTVTVNSDATVTAIFAENTGFAALILKVNDDAIGSTNPGVYEYKVPAGEPFPIEAVPYKSWHFNYWTVEGSAELECGYVPVTTVTLKSDVTVTVTAVFGGNHSAYKLALTVNDSAMGSTNPGSFTYDIFQGEHRRVIAVPAEGHHFVKWEISGPAAVGSTNLAETYVTATGNAGLKAIFEGDSSPVIFDIEVAGTGGGTNLGVGSYDVQPGTAKTITAVPPAGHHFVKWIGEGDLVISDIYEATTVVVVNAGNVKLIPVFEANSGDATLTIANSAGGQTNPGAGNYDVMLGAPQKIVATAADGYHFTGWTTSGNATITESSENTAIATLAGGAGSVTANFTKNTEALTLTIAVSPADSGTTNPGTGQRTVYAGESVQLGADAAEGYCFSHWNVTGDAVLNEAVSANATLTINSGDITATANFVEDQGKVALTTLVSPADSGTVDPATADVNIGCKVRIVATPATNYHFVEWTTSESASIENTNSPSTMVTLSAAASATAVFEKNEPVFRVTVGSEFTIGTDDVAGVDTFEKPPTLFAKIGKKDYKAQVRGITKNDSGVAQLVCEWRSKVPVGQYELWLVPKEKGKKNDPIRVTSQFHVMAPVITGTNVSGAAVTVTGHYFGSKKPKTWITYTDPKKNKQVKKSCKVATPMRYQDANKKSGRSCMNLQSGDSEVSLTLNKKTPRGVTLTLHLKNSIDEVTTELVLNDAGETESSSVVETASASRAASTPVTWSDVPKLQQLQALRRAQIVAYRSLAERIYGHVTSSGKTVYEYMVANPELSKALAKMIVKAEKVGEPELSEDGLVTYVCEIDLGKIRDAVNSYTKAGLSNNSFIIQAAGFATLPDSSSTGMINARVAAMHDSSMKILKQMLALKIGNGKTLRDACVENDNLVKALLAFVKGIDPMDIDEDDKGCAIEMEIATTLVMAQLSNELGNQIDAEKLTALNPDALFQVSGFGSVKATMPKLPKSLADATNPKLIYIIGPEVNAMLK